MTELLDRKRSVTREDFLDEAQAGGVFYWSIIDPGAALSPVPTLPRHGSRDRDRVLSATLDLEDMWSSAVQQAVTKIAAQGWKVTDGDDSTRRTEKGQSLLMDFDGPAEWTTGIAKVMQDYLLTDNGAFVEIERESKSASSRPRALWHLDTFRCWRTGNLDYPVIYQDYDGMFHKLPAANVLMFSDMPSPRTRLFNLGRCAASRAFATIVKLSAVETYFREKITGSRGLALYFISGVSPRQLQDAMTTSDAEQSRKGYTVFKGAVMVPIQGEQVINVASIDLAGVPDGFDVDQERRDAYLRYANALGVPVQDIQPLSGQGLGTGTQTIVLDEAASGRGLAYFLKQWEHKVSRLVLPKTTVFGWDTNDLRDQKAKADVEKAKADTVMALMGTDQAPGVISREMALQMLVDAGIVPKEFLPKDVTPAGVLTDSGEQSKPTDTSRFAGLPTPEPPGQPAVTTMATKADDVDALLDEELTGALDVLRKVASGE